MTVNAAGSYFWIASYSGDANNDLVSGTCGDAGETSVVSPASPAISTSATNAIAGGTIQDTATLSGGTNLTGTITFSCSATPSARTRSARTTSSRSAATATTPAPP